ncbi:MAG: hypothetical protein AB9915_03055 [Candidatus Dojkabacteria bacterium]
MEKKSIIGVAVLLLLLVLIGAIAYQIYIGTKDTNDDSDGTNSPQSITKDNFTFEYTYKGNNLWEYTVKGELPNPCYKISTDAIVAESYPEQVSVTSTITAPQKDVICAQVIQNVNEVGEFNASEKATVSFKIVNQ